MYKSKRDDQWSTKKEKKKIIIIRNKKKKKINKKKKYKIKENNNKKKQKKNATLQERHMKGIYTKPTLTELHSKQRFARYQCPFFSSFK